MPRRTQLFQQIPATGGINTAVDSGVIPPNDLAVADHIIFGTSGSRLKREGLDYFDALSAIPTVTHRSSSGTTRTLVFNATLRATGTVIDKLVAGESITVAGGPATYNGNFTIASITTTSVTDDTLTYTAGSSLNEGSTSTSAITVSRNHSYINITDYWRTDGSNIKVQRVVAVTSDLQFFFFDADGRRNFITVSGTALSNGSTVCNTVVMNDRLIFSFDKAGDTPKMYDPETSANVQDLTGTPPDFSVAAVHQSRLWTNQKSNKDRLNYSSPGNHAEWNGTGDSGAIDIDPGDGDPEGITAIFGTFRGDLVASKATKLFRVLGDAPENYMPQTITTGVGAISQSAVTPVDVDDMTFVSYKGFHSLAATQAHGDFEGSYLSSKIQPTFNDFNVSRLKHIKSVYVPELNSIVFACPAVSGGSVNSDLFLYNTDIKEWYKWPSISCQSIARKLVSGRYKLLIGSNAGRISEAMNGDFTDYDSTGIAYKIKTGTIYPDNNPFSVKAFKRLSFLYKPVGDFSFTVTVKIDNFEPQSLSFEQESDGAILGTDFTLGSSILGTSNVFAPFTLPIDGYGRGCTIEVTQSGSGDQVELYGFIIEYEPADIAQETLVT